MLINYHTTALDLELQVQQQKIEISRLKFEKQMQSISRNFAQELSQKAQQLSLESPYKANLRLTRKSITDLDMIPQRDQPSTFEKSQPQSSPEFFSLSIPKTGESVYTFKSPNSQLFKTSSPIMSPLRESELKETFKTSYNTGMVPRPPISPVQDYQWHQKTVSSGASYSGLTLEELKKSRRPQLELVSPASSLSQPFPSPFGSPIIRSSFISDASSEEVHIGYIPCKFKNSYYYTLVNYTQDSNTPLTLGQEFSSSSSNQSGLRVYKRYEDVIRDLSSRQEEGLFAVKATCKGVHLKVDGNSEIFTIVTPLTALPVLASP